MSNHVRAINNNTYCIISGIGDMLGCWYMLLHHKANVYDIAT